VIRFVGMLVAEPGTRSTKRWQENITIGIGLLDCELDWISSKVHSWTVLGNNHRNCLRQNYSFLGYGDL
jgi:hypothetical protein